MNTAPLLEIMNGIELLNVDPGAKREFSNLVRGISLAHGCFDIERHDRTAFAKALLAQRVSRPTVRDRLIATFGVSRPQAYRIIDAALQLSQNRPRDETTSGSNGVLIK